jgi:flagellar basal-body rod modification protein FlgD
VTTINNSNNITDFSSQFKAEKKDAAEQAAETTRKELGQEDFFSLLTQELAYQDPFKPVENSDMVAQMASFTTADGISNMDSKFEQLNTIMSSNQALQASGLVGTKVLAPASSAFLSEGEDVSGRIELPQNAPNLRLQIANQVGEVVKVLDMGEQKSGAIAFNWDGTDMNGKKVAEGSYRLKASASIDGNAQDLKISSFQHVESVNIGNTGNGIMLNLKGMGSLPLSQATEVAAKTY